MTITSYAVKGLIGDALGQLTPESDSLAGLATFIDSDLSENQSEDLSFLGDVPAVREWIGERKVGAAVEYEHSVRLKKHELTFEFPVSWIRNDKTGLVEARVNSRTRRRMQHWGKQVAGLINDGATTTCFDGQFYFDTDHSWGKSGTINNDISFAAASGTTPTATEAADAIVAGWKQMKGFRDDQGEPIHEDLRDLAVVVPTAHADSHLLAITQKRLDSGSGGVDNPVEGLKSAGINFRLIASDRLTIGDAMVLVNVGPDAAPFIIARNEMLEEMTEQVENSEAHHRRDQFEWGLKIVDGREYGLFTDACLTTYT